LQVLRSWLTVTNGHKNPFVDQGTEAANIGHDQIVVQCFTHHKVLLGECKVLKPHAGQTAQYLRKYIIGFKLQ